MKVFNNKQKRSISLCMRQGGFTITEVVVAVAIFSFVVTAMMVLLNYTLRINRKTEAVRQTAQSIRNFVEFITKEMRNGQIDYSTDSTSAPITAVSPCPAPQSLAGSPALLTDTYGPGVSSTDTAYNSGSFPGYRTAYLNDNSDTHVGIINSAGERECFFWGKTVSTGTYDKSKNGIDYTDSPVCSYTASPPAACSNGSIADGESLDSLLMTKEAVAGTSSVQIINPPNVQVTFLRFFVRPAHDPYTEHQQGNNDRPRVQPSLSMLMQFRVSLPTGETVLVPYQTTISSDDYGIPK